MSTLNHYPRFHTWLRSWFSYLLLAAVVLTVGLAPKEYAIHVMIFWGAVTAFLVYRVHHWKNRAGSKYDGEIVDYVFAPTPMGTLFSSLARQNVSPDMIDWIKFMSSDLAYTDRYVKSAKSGEEPFLNILDRCSTMCVWYYGTSSDPNIKSPHPRMKFIQTTENNTEHTNLIKLKDGRSYVWYEPCHYVVINEGSEPDDYFGGGAYLIALNEAGEKQAERAFARFKPRAIDQTVEEAFAF